MSDPISDDINKEMERNAKRRGDFEISRAKGKRRASRPAPPASRIRPLMDKAGKLIDIAVGGMRLSKSCLFNNATVTGNGADTTCDLVTRPNGDGTNSQWLVCDGKPDVKIIDNDTDTTIPNTDALAALNCAPGQVAKWDGTEWVCADDNDIDTTIPNTDGLAALNCANGQVPKYNSVTGEWECADDIAGSGGTADTDTTFNTTREFRDFWCYEVNGEKFQGTIVEVTTMTNNVLDNNAPQVIVITEYRDASGAVVDPANFTVIDCAEGKEWKWTPDKEECFIEEGDQTTEPDPFEVTLKYNLSCHLVGLLDKYLAAYGNEVTIFNEFCGKHETGYWAEITEEVLSYMSFRNRCKGNDVGTQAWTIGANGGYPADYQCRIANGSATGITDISPNMGIYNSHLGDNPRNGYAFSGMEGGFEPDYNGRCDTNPTLTGTGGIAGIQIPSVQTFEDLINAGVEVFRLPIRFERLFPNVFATPSNYNMDPLYKSWIDDYYANLATANANLVTSATMYIDPHNYGAYMTCRLGAGNETQVLTGANYPHFEAMILAIAGNANWNTGGIELINEPKHYPSAAAWQNDSQSLVNALCAAGFTGDIYVDFYPWSGLQDVLAQHPTPWITVPSGCNITPVYAPHWYFDANTPTSTPWDEFEDQATSESQAVCDSQYKTYEDCGDDTTIINEGACKAYKVFRKRLCDETGDYFDDEKQYRDPETDEIVDVSNLQSVDCKKTTGDSVRRFSTGNADVYYPAATVSAGGTELGASWSGVQEERKYTSSVPCPAPEGCCWVAHVKAHTYFPTQRELDDSADFQHDAHMKFGISTTFNGSQTSFPNTSTAPAFFDAGQGQVLPAKSFWGLDITTDEYFKIPKADEMSHVFGQSWGFGVQTGDTMPNINVYINEIHIIVHYILISEDDIS